MSPERTGAAPPGAADPPPEKPPEDQAGPPGEPEAIQPAMRGLGWRLLVPLLLGLLALVGLAVFADARELAQRLREFDLAILVPVLALSLVNYGLRFVRWHVYLLALGIRLPAGRSLAVVLVGFLLSVTPGKAGELGKAWLVRELGGGPARRAIPAVLAERVTDLLAVLLMIAGGALPFPGGPWIAAGCLSLTVTAVALLSWRSAAEALFGRLERMRRIGPKVAVLHEMYDRLRRLLSPRLLAGGLALAFAAWAAEGLGFLLVLRAYEPGAGVAASFFDYGVSTLAGAVSMLPGGLLASEGALAALLGTQGLEPAAAASATLIIRAATLWFAVLLGLLALPLVLRWLRRRG